MITFTFQTNLNSILEQGYVLITKLLLQANDLKIMSFGVLIIGPSGSGKSTLTYCLSHLYRKLDIDITIINLDPANESTNKYTPDIDINELINVEDVMEEFGIGPNASMIYCMEFLEKNCDWLIEKIKQRPNSLLIIDLPGQIELYVNHESLKGVIERIQKLSYQMVMVELFDCTYVYELKHFISMCVMSLCSMINFELPHINVLNKIDLMKGRRLGTQLYDYINATNLAQMVEFMNTKQSEQPLLSTIAKVIDNYGLVSFSVLDVNRIELVSSLIFQIENTLGILPTRESNRKFKVFMQKYYKSDPLDKEQMMLELELELFDQQEHSQQQFLADLAKDK